MKTKDGENNQSKRKKLLRTYGITIAVGVLLGYLYLCANPLSDAPDMQTKFVFLCNAAFVPGILFVLAGLLAWSAGQGSIDGLTYSLGLFFKTINPFEKHVKIEKYHEYIERKNQKRLNGKGYLFLFVIGGAFVFVSTVLYVISLFV